MEKQIIFYDGGHDYWRVNCDTVYLNDVESVNDWVKRHHGVYADEFEHGFEYYSSDGGHMFDIVDFMRITVTVEDGVEVWYLE